MTPEFRVLPRVTDENRHFWTGGAEGKLRFLRCERDGTWIHPPSPVCPTCLSKDIGVATASGRGVVHTYTINQQPWIPGFDPPYVIAIIELEEQPGLRLTTNIAGCEPDDVHIGMPVQVVFEHREDVWLPLFEPRSDKPTESGR